MAQLCPRCRRANPDVASFCYFDGMMLREGAVPPGTGDLTAEFVFPSGRRCRTFDELVAGCQAEWEEARRLLQRGEIARYLGRLGRIDLARDAEEAQNQPDPDIALYNFLNQLPVGQVQGPRLDLYPRRLVLKQLKVGDQHKLQMTVGNQGKGTLQGKVTVSEGHEWLKLLGGDDRQVAIKTARDQDVTLLLDTRVLVGGQTYSARLTVITNGGIGEVPVKLELKAVPFPHAPYQGATTPRELAQRIKNNPKPAVPLLESGKVSTWFAANGWNYPVPGDPAKGVAAIQQLFECLGLSKPPPLQLSESEVRFECQAPEVATGEVALRTPTRKWVYAQVDSDVPWLRVTTPYVSGPQQAAISFEVDSAQLEGGQTHQGQVQIRANGGQRLPLRVKVEVRKPRVSAGVRWFKPLLTGVLLALLFRLLLVLPADLYARLLASRPGPVSKGTLALWQTLPGAEDGFLRQFVLSTWWLGALAGLIMVWRRGGHWTDRFCAAVAGGAAGIALFSVLGCLLILVDGLPRAVLRALGLAGTDLSAWVATPLWVMTAVLCWTLLGGCLGLLLSALGARGANWLATLAAPLAGLFRLCGLGRLANLVG